MPQLGKISGSRFKAMMTSGRKKDQVFGATALTLAKRIAFERAGYILEEDNYVSAAMQWGIDHEDEAIQALEEAELLDVHSQQVWQQHPDFENVGVTPDGLIGEDAVLEVKCPNTDNHIDNILFGSQIELYKYQLQGSLWVTGRKRCYFVSYDPRVKVRLAVHQVERDDDLIAEMQGRYLHFEAEIKKIQEML
jgi:predicted phage-related endonuclease